MNMYIETIRKCKMQKEKKSSDVMKTLSHTDLTFKDKHRISYLQSCLR